MRTLCSNTLTSLEASFDGGLPPVKPPFRPVKLGNGGDKKPAHAKKAAAPSLPAARVEPFNCLAQQDRPDFADEIDRLVQQLLRDGDVRWSETQGYHAPKRTYCFAEAPTQLTRKG